MEFMAPGFQEMIEAGRRFKELMGREVTMADAPESLTPAERYAWATGYHCAVLDLDSQGRIAVRPMPVMTDLLPCPFCGGAADLHNDDNYKWWCVGCEECGFMTSECGINSEAEAIARWNRRTVSASERHE